ncbi:MAG TPA: 5-(carboxyamino)imidazole ribonucleotide mutase [Anaerolineae bacterium]|nr:5-(carboxyamino)imidazole ribonucleotide mutase [Anaerolineae bacterium]
MPQVSVVYGSKSDENIMQEAFETLEEFGIDYEHKVLSAHRHPEETAHYAKSASSRGIKVIIAGAGLSAALPGVIASHTILPVIGVPIGAGPLNGVDALYSMVQMPKGIPVATVGISNAKNASVLAVQILAVADEHLAEKMADYRRKLGE